MSNRKRTVLYIEDNPANLRLIVQTLEMLPNVQIYTALDPELGLSLASEYVPDLILLDINLPNINGFEVLKQLRNHDITRHIPVFAISANAIPKDIKKGEKAGFDRYITKPINIKKFLAFVEEEFSNKTALLND